MKKAGFVCLFSMFVGSLVVGGDLVAQETVTIPINFAADEPPGIGSEVEGAAGILGSQDWNNLELNFGIAGDLIDSNGNETNASIIWESNNTWASAPVDGQGRSENNIEDSVPTGPDRLLMTGYIDSNDVDRFCTPDESNNPLFGGPNWCGANRVIVGGLPYGDQPYEVILYLNGGVPNRSGLYQLNNDDPVGHHDVGPFNGIYDVSSEERNIGGELLTVWTGDVIIFSEVFGDSFEINTRADDFGGTTDGFRSLINAIEITGMVGTGLPCDFDGDGICNVVDIDLLGKEIIAGTNNLDFDVNGDGSVNLADQDQWRSDAATANGFSEPYLPGDANLDGSVLVGDLNILGTNWQQSPDPWGSGDFNVDGIVDVADLNLLALNWQESIPAAAAAVPEPASFVLALGALLLLMTRRL